MNALRRTPESAIAKIGTDSITPQVIAALARDLAMTRKEIHQIVLISSGAMQFGREDQGVKKEPGETVSDKKFFAAIGQPLLMAAYAKAFKKYGLSVAQGLVTWDDFDSRKRRKQLEDVLDRTFTARKPTIAILNENDVTADDEFVRFTDNDHLTAEAAYLIEAEAVLFLTQKNGLRRDVKDARTRVISVQPGDGSWRKWVPDEVTGNGKGGMKNKCQTAAELADKGIETFIAAAHIKDAVYRILINRERIGTHFIAKSR